MLSKFRVAVADTVDAVADMADAVSGCSPTRSTPTKPDVQPLNTAAFPAIGACQDSADVDGAYFHDIPPDMAHGGRRLHVRIPRWPATFFPAYLLREPERGPAFTPTSTTSQAAAATLGAPGCSFGDFLMR